jgi:hypothetical protein
MNAATVTSTQTRAERFFFSAMAAGMAAVVFVGFSRTFFLRWWFPEAQAFAAPEPIFYLHGALFASWMVLLIVQTTLIRTDRVALHRTLGVFSPVLAAAMVVIGVVGCLTAAGRPGGFIGVPVPPLQFMALPLLDLVLFGLFVGLGIALRGDAQSHKRLMLLATVNLLEAAIIRIPFAFIADGAPLMARWLADLFILALAIWDLVTRRRLHPVTLWGGLLIIASQPLRLLIAGTDSWLAFAHWAVGSMQ